MTQWLSLREAAAVLEKTPKLAEKPDDRPLRAKLYDMFQSGKVKTFANDGVSVVPLGMKDFLDPCFGMDLEQGLINLPRLPPKRFHLQVSSADLKAYLRDVPPEYVDREGLFAMIGKKYSHQGLLDLEAAGKFPKRVRLGSGGNAPAVWVKAEVQDWALAWLRERDKKNPT